MKQKAGKSADEMRPEYDLRKLKFVGRGIYAERSALPDDETVNEGLIGIAKTAKQQASRAGKSLTRNRR